MSHPDLKSEQAYVDRAYEHLERMRAAVEAAPAKIDDEVLGKYLDAWAARRLVTFEDAERGLCFGRLDLESIVKPLYVGRRWVHDEDQQMVVVNWQAPAARPFYTATPADPQRVTLRRRFRTRGRRVLEISDETLDGSTASVAGGDFLLEELERTRDRHMRDIVATIQTDQYALITRDPAAPLVVQGGPGTGKTAVGLHRASFLLYTHRERLGRRGVLVVGPNETFMEYVSHVLPTLGEESVEQRAVGELVDGVAATRVEADDVARVKGDPRLAEVIAGAVAALPPGEPEEIVVRVDGEYPNVKASEIAEILATVHEELGRTAAARERFRTEVLRSFYRSYARKLGSSAWRSFDEIEQGVRSGGYLNRKLDKAWPSVSAEQLVRRLLTSPSRLAEAAGGILDRAEQQLVLRDRPRRAADLSWSVHDLPLLDEARTLLEGAPRRFGHVIVDEAQDLTPMQLRMIGRRIEEGSYTLLGDVAQATGPVTYRRWEELLPHLPHGGEASVEELRHAYRVPAEIMELALPLLDRIAPEIARPIAFRPGGEPPRFRETGAEHVLAHALEEAAALAREDGLLAVIAPAQLLAQAEGLREVEGGGSAYHGSIPLLTARGRRASSSTTSSSSSRQESPPRRAASATCTSR